MSLARFFVIAVGLVLVLIDVTPSWGGPPNPTASDANANTAGGSGALFDVTSGGISNTAFGFYAEVAMLRKELADLRALVGQGREMAASSR